MVFSSVSFLFFFLPAVLAVYYLIPARLRGARNTALLVFSLFFYAFGGPRFLLLMLASITVNYTCGLFAAPGRNLKTRKLAVAAAVILGLALLGWFKYSGFLAETINMLRISVPVPKVALPIGISFFTFQGLSYVIDVYRGNAATQKNPLKVALYISLFPQLIAGPIVRYTTIESAIDTRVETIEDFSAGAVRFAFGLAKKMLLANSLGEIADALFAIAPGSLSITTAWVGAIAYTGQLYFDFSAYSDMALGLGRMFGFHFLENFNYPYISKSVTEFWRRWHISLSTWFRDYLYIPLGGSRVSRAKHIRNIVVVWLLTGLWHGAAWNFVIWGAWVCLLLLCEAFVWGKSLEKAPTVLRHVYALALIIVTRIFFRSETVSGAALYIGAMFGSSGILVDGQGVFYLVQYWPEMLFAVIASMPVKNKIAGLLESKRGALSAALYEWGPRALALAMLALSYMKLVTGSYNPFIYFRF